MMINQESILKSYNPEQGSFDNLEQRSEARDEGYVGLYSKVGVFSLCALSEFSEYWSD